MRDTSRTVSYTHLKPVAETEFTVVQRAVTLRVVTPKDGVDQTLVNPSTQLSLCLLYTSYHVLREAGVQDTDLLIAVTAHDEINLLSCLIARKDVYKRQAPHSCRA